MLVLDADAWIKLYRSGLLEKACENFKCMMTAEVFDEVVTAGLKLQKEDALLIQKLIAERQITMLDAGGRLRAAEGMGRGESSVLESCLKRPAVAVSDDAHFLTLLEREGIAFQTPATLILAMHELKMVDRATAKAALEKLRPWIRKTVFDQATTALKEVE